MLKLKYYVDEKMPFVNRHEELWKVFSVNALNMEVIERQRGPLINTRSTKLLFCVQYYGAGKTTLGLRFPELVTKDSEVQQYISHKINNVSFGRDVLTQAWTRLQNSGIEHVFIDVRTSQDIVLKTVDVLGVARNNDASVTPPPVDDVADLLLSRAATKAVLYHFDEVGSDQQHDLNKLRQLAVATWSKMRTFHSMGMEIPQVYFLVTGRSTEPFEDIGSSSSSSPW